MDEPYEAARTFILSSHYSKVELIVKHTNHFDR